MRGLISWALTATTLLGLASATSLRSSGCKGPRCLAEVDTAGAVAPATEAGPVRYRGVNLGGWLVLESWMYPEWWKTTGVETWVGEWQFCEKLGQAKARKFLEKHWDTWVTKKDLENLKSAGIEHLRVPIGYWILGEPYLKKGEPFVVGGWKYLMRALGWAKELGLKVIIDLHGAPGSQNGHDNCGISGGMSVIHWNEPENLQRTNEILVYLANNLTAINAMEEYEDVVQGLCILNEPWTTKVGGPITLDEVKAWVQTAVDLVIEAGWKGDIWYPDGFDLTWEGWQDFLRPPMYKNVYIDSHYYWFFEFTSGNSRAEELTMKTCMGYYKQQLNAAKDISSGVLIGEWSMDYKQYSLAYPLDRATHSSLQRLFLAQAQTYGLFDEPGTNHVKGAFYWSFKSLGRVDKKVAQMKDNPHSPWDYLAMWTDGIAVKDLNTVTPDQLVCKADGTVAMEPVQGGQDPNLPPEGGGQ